MKAITIREPYASQILWGEKTIETRTWATGYRGPLLITVSLKPAGPFAGKAICVANVLDCVPMGIHHETRACVKRYPRAMAWLLGKVTPIKPFKVKGRLGLFEVSASPAMLKEVNLWEVQP